MSQEAKHFDFLQGFRGHQGAKGGFNLLRDDIPEGLKRVPGIYIIETTNRFKFPYPGGKSNILYIGMSKDLDQRFREHRSAVQKIHNDPDYGIDDFVVVNTKYQYMAPGCTIMPAGALRIPRVWKVGPYGISTLSIGRSLSATGRVPLMSNLKKTKIYEEVFHNTGSTTRRSCRSRRDDLP